MSAESWERVLGCRVYLPSQTWALVCSKAMGRLPWMGLETFVRGERDGEQGLALTTLLADELSM